VKRRLAIILSSAIGLLIAGCGTSAHTVHRHPAFTEVFTGGEHVVSLDRLVHRSVQGVSFLAPVQLDPGTIDFIHPKSVNVPASFAPRATSPGIDASSAHVIDRPDHVEVLATGPVGMPVDIVWEETCGFHRDGNGPAESGGSGGEGQTRARLPAILAVKLPQWSTGEDSCYVSSMLVTNNLQSGLSVELINS
jgi:hypothetical protein